MVSPVAEAGMAVWMAVSDRRISPHSSSSRRAGAGGSPSRPDWSSPAAGDRRRGSAAVTSKGIRFSLPTFVAKMVKAVVMLSPISLHACSMLFFTSSSMRKLTITCAICATSVPFLSLYHL